MQDNNPIDDAGFDALLKEHGVQPQQQAEASNAWSEFDLGAAEEEPSFIDGVKSKAVAAYNDPLEAAKGALKGGIKGTVDVTKGLDWAGKKMLGAVGVDTSNMGLDFTGIDEATQYSNEAQKGGGMIENVAEIAAGGKGLLKPGKEALIAGKEYITKKGAEKTANFVKDLITPELSASKTATAIKTGKVKEGGIFKDRDITEAVPFFKDIEKVVSEVPGISKSKTLLENSNAIHDHIGTVADDLVSQLKIHAKDMKIANLEQVPAKFNEYMKGVKTTLKENPTLVGDAEKTATKILNKFESLVKEEGSTPDAILSARKKLDTWMSTQKGENIFDPKTEGAVSVALRAIRQGGNDFISSLAKDANGKEIVKVKDMLARQTSLYDAIENIAPKAAKEGASGFKRWVRSHPKIVGATKILGGAAVGGGTAGALLNQ